jgi:hypothetical protein
MILYSYKNTIPGPNIPKWTKLDMDEEKFRYILDVSESKLTASKYCCPFTM